ncbi:MAG: hypothetical protein GY820_29960 [Gammaproteobacteria bacterium]|nr:hypothetical protein [Gammaproteobacteria bacterium]
MTESVDTGPQRSDPLYNYFDCITETARRSAFVEYPIQLPLDGMKTVQKCFDFAESSEENAPR